MFKDLNLLSQPPVLPFETRSSRTQIHITGCAGLVKLDKIRNDVATYWEKQDVEAFGVHIFETELSVDQRLDGTPINTRRSQKNWRSEEHTSELQSLMRISYAVFCMKKKN